MLSKAVDNTINLSSLEASPPFLDNWFYKVNKIKRKTKTKNIIPYCFSSFKEIISGNLIMAELNFISLYISNSY